MKKSTPDGKIGVADPTKDSDFQKVVGHFLTTKPKTQKEMKADKSPKTADDKKQKSAAKK